MTTEFWYVISREPEPDSDMREWFGDEAEQHVDAWGPFDSETDARAFAIDLYNDNGWESVTAELMTPAAAANESTQSTVRWPYEERGQLTNKEKKGS